MKRLFLAVMVVLISASGFGQKAKSETQRNKLCPPTQQSVNSRSTQPSVSRISDLNVIQPVSGGYVFIGGYNTDFSENRVKGYGVLLKVFDADITLKTLPFLSSIDSMFWLDSSTGWVTGYGEGTFHTTDGGENWKKVQNSDHVRASPFFLDETLGWYFGKDGYLKRLEDNRVENLKLFDGFPFVKKLQFTSRENGWLFDVVDTKSRFRHTKDGGKTWTPIHIDRDDVAVSDFQFIDNHKGFAIASGDLFKTDDRGESWKLIKKQTRNSALSKLFFIDQETGWVVSWNRSCSTTNGGVNWKCSSFGVRRIKTIRNVAFTDSRNGWLLAENGLYFTNNGSKTWELYPINIEGMNFSCHGRY